MKNNYRKHILRITLSVILIISAVIGTFAVSGRISPESAGGTFSQKIVNRVNFSVDNTDFTFRKSEADNGTYILSFNFSAMKTEADFYAKINSFDISGIGYESMMFYAAPQNKDSIDINSLELKSENGVSTNMQWTVEIVFSADAPCVISPEIVINYTSGIKYELSENYNLSIPLNITIE